MVKYFLIIIFIVFVGCSSSKPDYEVNLFSETNPVIKMTKTNCFGRCPVYDLEIKGNGDVVLTGRENIDKIGEYKLRIDKSEIVRLLSKIDEVDFWGMKDEYDGRVTDLPSTYISVNYNGKSKKIKSRYNSPKELDELEGILSAYLERFGWIEIKN
ncbi:MAG: hypothetical protein KKA84_03145 [Bacteroidetes bacterium]|nr:hypothetical protein [Bacteroidota bacterium]